MNKFKQGDKVVNIITNKKGKVFQTWDNVEDVQKDKGQFSRKYHVVYNDGTECINSIVEIEKLPDILDEKEKEYLRNVLKPFKDRVLTIEKRNGGYGIFRDLYYLLITIKGIYKSRHY